MNEQNYEQKMFDEQLIIHELKTRLRPISSELLQRAIFEQTVCAEKMVIPNRSIWIGRIASHYKIKGYCARISVTILTIFAFVLGMGTMYMIDRFGHENPRVTAVKSTDFSEVIVSQTDRQNSTFSGHQILNVAEESKTIVATELPKNGLDTTEKGDATEKFSAPDSMRENSLEPLLMCPFMLTDAQFDRLLKLCEKQTERSSLFPSYQPPVRDVPRHPGDLAPKFSRSIRTEEDMRKILNDYSI